MTVHQPWDEEDGWVSPDEIELRHLRAERQALQQKVRDLEAEVARLTQELTRGHWLE